MKENTVGLLRLRRRNGVSTFHVMPKLLDQILSAQLEGCCISMSKFAVFQQYT